MNTYKLNKEACMNPYYINNIQLKAIHFFKDGEIVASTNRGWLPLYGSNNSGNSALEGIEYRRKNKIDLTVPYSYYIGENLYVNADELPGFLFAPDVLELETKEAKHYGNRVYFMCGSTDGRFEHLESVELRSFMTGSYSRIVPTPYGEKVAAVVAVFSEAGVKLSTYDANNLLDNASTIIAAMEDEKAKA